MGFVGPRLLTRAAVHASDCSSPRPAAALVVLSLCHILSEWHVVRTESRMNRAKGSFVLSFCCETSSCEAEGRATPQNGDALTISLAPILAD